MSSLSSLWLRLPACMVALLAIPVRAEDSTIDPVSMTEEVGWVADLGPALVQPLSLSPTFDFQANSSDGQVFSVSDGATYVMTQQIPWAYIYRRGVIEFSLSAVPANLRIETATLRLNIAVITYDSAGYPLLNIYGYAGDGVKSGTDALNLGNRIGQIEVRALGLIDIPLDAAFVDSLAGQATHLGLVLFDPDSGHQVAFDATEGARWGFPPPVLTLECAAAMPGDVDGNGCVDVFDIIATIDAFGSEPGAAKWNPNADFNGNGRVDVFDVITVVNHFGQCL